MKSRKKLKKGIKKAFDVLYQKVVDNQDFTFNADEKQSEALFLRMLVTEEELIKRVSVREGKEVKGRLKMYFGKLKQDLTSKTNKFATEIDALK